MRTDLLNTYTNGIKEKEIDSLNTRNTKRPGEVNISQKVNKDIDFNSVNNNSKSYNNIITKNERSFFIKMFPDNAEQIQNHILFNRNGKINTPNINKGSIVDGRV